MTVKVITTLHEDGYNLYGKQNIQTWIKNFPKEWEIVYYAEKHQPEFNDRVTVVDFNENCPEWENFYLATKNSYTNSKNKNQKIINWHKKALRWSFKSFSLLHALKNSKSKYLIWLDSDVVARRTPIEDWIQICLNEKCMAGQLEHIKAGGHVETGVLIFDLEHPDIKKIIDWVDLGYNQQKILKEEKAWDGIWMAKLVMSNSISWNNLTMVVKTDIAKAFSNDNLKWLAHKVGKEKFKASNFNVRSGRSEENELIKEQL